MNKEINLGINGFGRIGRLAFRIASQMDNVNIIAVNDLTPINKLAYLLKYDSVHGRFSEEIKVGKNHLVINGKKIKVTAKKDPQNLNWTGVDIVLECTGVFKSPEEAGLHIKKGAKKVLISAPSKDVSMYVMGVNHKQITADQKIVSNASCTTNCLAVFAKIIQDNFGIEEALMTTVHAVTASQSTVDYPATKNNRIGRSAFNNIIPTSTGAADATAKVIPALKGKITGMAFRVPTADVSAVDLTVRTEKETSLKMIQEIMKKAAENELQGILAYTEDEVVSTDFISDPHSCIFDADACIELNPNFFKLVAWYDNEYGYAQRLVDLALYINEL